MNNNVSSADAAAKSGESNTLMEKKDEEDEEDGKDVGEKDPTADEDATGATNK